MKHMVLALPYTTGLVLKDKVLTDDEALEIFNDYEVIRECNTDVEAAFALSTHMTMKYGNLVTFNVRESSWRFNGKTNILPGMIMSETIYRLTRGVS